MNHNPKKKYSLYSGMIRVFVILCVIFYLVIGATLIYVHDTILYYTTDSYTKSVEKQIHQLNNQLETSRKFYISVLFNNLDLANLASTNNSFIVSLSQSHLSQYISTLLPNISPLDGLFFYAHRSDSFVSASLDRISGECEHVYFKNLLRSDEYNHIYESTTKTYRKWIIMPVNSSYYLVSMASYNDCVAGAWVNISTLINSLNETLPENSLSYFIETNNGNTKIMSPQGYIDFFSYSPSNNNKLISLDSISREKYLQLNTELPFFNGSFISLIPTKEIQTSMAYYDRFLIMTLFINLIILVFLFAKMRKYMSIPVVELRRISDNLKEGEDEYLSHQQSDSRCKEVCEVQTEVIRLYQKIFDLRNKVLSEQYMKQAFELKSLRNQVSPHFLINCLSSIYSMANTNASRDLMKRVIAALSGHLRYTLSTKSFVSLSEEIQHVENYFELMNLRYPGSLKYTVTINDLCDNAAIFPSLILMLSENSIKHNLVMGEILTITISVWEEVGPENKSFIHIVHYDTGRGYPQDVLDRLKINSLNPSETSDGYGIGLSNIVNRIHLIYGEHGGTISFTNHESNGAKIDVRIPYIPYQES